jgi:hypothetical protein
VTGAEGVASTGKVIPSEAGAAERATGPIGVSEVVVIGKVTPKEAGAAERALGPVGVSEVVWLLGAWGLVWHDGHRMDECSRLCLLQRNWTLETGVRNRDLKGVIGLGYVIPSEAGAAERAAGPIRGLECGVRPLGP